MNKNILLIAISLLFALHTFSQGLTCETSEPFCTGSIYTFPAGTTGYAQPGANYGCLTTQPAPAWYHMLIDDPGNITIYMYSTPLVDIDFICWGPFDNPYDPCVAGLTSNKIVDCSYSPNPTEYCDITNGQTGQYYILLITNYSQQPCHITFSQTAGNGSTDCTILPPPVSNNGPLCIGETLNLYAETVINASYWWSGPGGFLSAQQNPVIPNVTMANAGSYSCIITVNGQSSDPAITNVVIYNQPTASLLSDDTTICIGTQAAIQFQLTGWSPFEIDYTDGTNNYTATGIYGPVGTVYLSPTSPTTYTFTQVRDLHCERNLLFSQVEVDTYPLTSATLSGGGAVCAGEPASLTLNLTGTPPWSVVYTANGGNPQTVATNSNPHTFQVYPTGTTTYELESVNDQYCSGEISGTANITVNPSPTANAGSDQTLPYGANTTLNGQASGGSGNYQYSWEPASKLINPNVAAPTTANLTESTVFTLTVTDNSGGCQGTDNMLVSITGGPLGCTPYASPAVICHGETTQLYAMASGGSGTYTYSWSSVPSGFSSSLPDPVVNPAGTTTYYVTINDGYNVSNGNIAVTVHARPVADAGNDQNIPHGTSTQLFGYGAGGSGNYTYHWEPADKLDDPSATSPHTHNLYTTTVFHLTLTDNITGCESASPSEVEIVVSGGALAASPVATPSEICEGDTVFLSAAAGGGSGTYTYIWTSNPAGFTSGLSNPFDIPGQTTIYQVTVDDGYNLTSGFCPVTVLDAPELYLGPNSVTVCVYDTVKLDAGNPGASYLWSNGATTRINKIASTGLGFDVQNHSVVVTNPSGCTATAEVTITFDFSACSGIDDHDRFNPVSIYPNPGKGSLRIRLLERYDPLTLKVSDVTGRTLAGPYELISAVNQDEIILDLGILPPGIYFLHFNGADGLSAVYKYFLRK